MRMLFTSLDDYAVDATFETADARSMAALVPAS
jgi:hypothetical protein